MTEPIKKCKIGNCENKLLAKNMCAKHYKRFKIYGDVNFVKNKNRKYSTLDECFLDQFIISDKEQCWEWKGTKTLGYGLVCAKNKSIKAHRYSYEYFIGKIKNGLVVCHKCDNPPCVNPNHLFLGTQLDNIKDMFDKKRYRGYPKEKIPFGVINGHSKLDDIKIKEILILILNGLTHNEIAIKYNVHRTCISAIAQNKTWKHISR